MQSKGVSRRPREIIGIKPCSLRNTDQESLRIYVACHSESSRRDLRLQLVVYKIKKINTILQKYNIR